MRIGGKKGYTADEKLLIKVKGRGSFLHISNMNRKLEQLPRQKRAQMNLGMRELPALRLLEVTNKVRS